MMGNKKKIAVALGVLMGISGSFFAMIPSSHHTEAAIAVIDQRNIEEAIKTAIKTAKILTDEQKQLALMVLNAKKIDLEQIAGFEMNHDKKLQEWMKDMHQYDGVLNAEKPIAQIWKERVGDIQDVLEGRQTVYDVWKTEKSRQKLEAATAKDAAEAARKVVLNQKVDAVNLQTAVNTLNNAEGTLQAQQAQGEIAAQGVYATHETNQLLTHLVEMEATKQQGEILKEAQIDANEANSAADMHEFASKIDRKALGWE